MKPTSPVIPGQTLPEYVIAKDQPPYLPLPVIFDGEKVTSRWALSWRERLRVLIGGSVWLQVRTCGQPLQPVRVSSRHPFEREEFRAAMESVV
jgi:hypothetical protein